MGELTTERLSTAIELALYRVADRIARNQISEPISPANVLRAVADEIAAIRSPQPSKKAG